MAACILGIFASAIFSKFLGATVSSTMGAGNVVLPILPARLISFFLFLFLIFIAAWFPARKAGKINTIQAIRSGAPEKQSRKKASSFGISFSIPLFVSMGQLRQSRGRSFSTVLAFTLVITSFFFMFSLKKV